MITIRDFIRMDSNPCRILTIGSFDGLHAGHQKILHRMMQEKAATGCPVGLVTFSPHPQVLLRPDEIKLLFEDDEKERRIAAAGVDHLFMLRFDQALASMDARDFITEILQKKIGFRQLFIGFNHAFGRNRSGNIKNLEQWKQELGYELEVVEPVLWQDKPISSTRIRRALAAGDIPAVTQMLGRPHQLTGTVVAGAGNGRRLGFPTLNLEIALTLVHPGPGVYLVDLELNGQTMAGMMNWGAAPTLGRESVVPEIHLLDQELSATPAQVTFRLLMRLRDIQRFTDTGQLLDQLQQDREQARQYFAEQTEFEAE